MSRLEGISGIEEKVIVITGASSGIGEATARLLGQRGGHLMLGARREERLKALVSDIRAQGGTADYQTVDVTKREQVESLVRSAQQIYGRVDVIINNAGVMPISTLDKLEVEKWDRMIDVNIKGVLYGIAAALPIMQKQKSGHFINVASVGGHIVVPTGAVYCATKFAVRAISEGLRLEMGRDIRVAIICPGVTESELAKDVVDVNRESMGRAEAPPIMLPDAIAQAISFAIAQPADVSVSEIIVRPTGGF